MAFVKPALIAFNGGEIGPETLARTDLNNYTRCAETAENVFLYAQGKMAKAPGTRYIGDALDNENVFLRSFSFAINDNLILVLTDEALQLVTGNAFVTVDGAAATVGAWSDESAAPSTGGGAAPPSGGGSGGDLSPPLIDGGGVWYLP